MIITCPNCKTDYNVNADVFPVTGRTVKCARCEQTWYALPVEEAAAAAEGAQGDDGFADTSGETVAADEASESSADRINGLDQEVDNEWDLPGDNDETLPATLDGTDDGPARMDVEFDGDIEVVEVSAEPAPEPESADEAEPRDGAEIVDDGEVAAEAAAGVKEAVISIERASRARSAAARFARGQARSMARDGVHRAKAMAVGGLIAVIAAGYIYREDIVRTVPSMAGFYELAGLEINLRGLEFADLEPIQEFKDGIPMLRVKGGIRNITDERVTVPPVRLSLTSQSGQEIYFWTIQPDTEALGPGEYAEFQSVLSAPPRGASSIAARFVDVDAMRVGMNR